MAQDIKKPKRVLTLRSCRYCRAKFVPARPQDKDAKFCCPNHRKNFWRFGGLPYDKLKEQIMRDVRKFMREEFARLSKGFGFHPEAARQTLTAIDKLERIKRAWQEAFSEPPVVSVETPTEKLLRVTGERMSRASA